MTILLSSIVVLVFITHQGAGQVVGCNTNILNTRQNLNISAFLGTWYRIQYSTMNLSATPSFMKCASIFHDYQPGSSTDLRGIRLYKLVSNNSWEAVHGNITIPDPSNPSVWHSNWDNSINEEDEFAVLSTDYANWAFVYACRVQGGVLGDAMNIWSRTKTLQPNLIAFIESLLIGLGWLFSKTIVIDQSDSSCL